MKLRQLDGEFFGRVDVAQKSAQMQGAQIEAAQGVMFQCPLCSYGKPMGPARHGFAGAHYVKVCFSNPRGALVAPTEYDNNPRWEMSGTSLDDLTLAPSINCDIPWKDENGVEHLSSCKWHGFVKNGEAG